MDPRAGDKVTANVRLLRPLGRGGMGSVWVAEHLTLETEVAVKFIAPEHKDKERVVKRFKREASSAAKLKSPHVVQIFDHGVTEDDAPYIVMELLHGESLAARVARDRRLPPVEVGTIVSQVAKVLAEAHQQGVIHRDLKPENIFLLEGSETFVKVLDFGIAKRVEEGVSSTLTDAGTLVGTPLYMSPEALQSSRDADGSVDWWSLAVVAYFCLTGQPPFHGDGVPALTIAIYEARYEPPTRVVPSLGERVDAWFARALARKAADRFESARELVSTFRAAVAMSLSDVSIEEAAPTEQAPRIVVPSPADGTAERAAKADTQPAVPPIRLALEGFETTVDSGQTGTPASSADEAARRRSTPASAPAQTLGGTTDAGTPRRGVPGRALGVGSVALAGVVAAAWFFASRDTDRVVRDVGRRAADAASSERAVAPPALFASTAAPSSLAPHPEPPIASASSAPPSSSATASAPSSSAPRSSPIAAPPPPPASASKPPPSATSSQPTSKPGCDQPFTVNAVGDLVPRPECF